MTIKQLMATPNKRVAIYLNLDGISELKQGKKSVYLASFSDNDDEITGVLSSKAPAQDYYSLCGDIVLVKGKFEDEQFNVYSINSDPEAVIDEGTEETPACAEEAPVNDENIASGDEKRILMYEKLKGIAVESHSKLLNSKKTADGGVLAREIENAPTRVLEALKALWIEPTREDMLLVSCVCAYSVIARLYLEKDNSFVEDEKDCGLGIGFVGSVLARKVAGMIKEDEADAYDLLALNRVEKELLALDFTACEGDGAIHVTFPELIKVSLLKGGVI